ncbi:MAG: aconitase family protein [Desulfobacterales bacterium]|nr:aconitase family protein [Desulfobacterales bacterium]
MVPGSEISIHIDQTLTQDALGTMAFLEFEAIGVQRVEDEALGLLRRSPDAPGRLRELRRPPVPDDGRGPVRRALLEARQRHLPPGAPGASRRGPGGRCSAATATRPPAGARGHARDRRRRAGRRRGHGRRALLPRPARRSSGSSLHGKLRPWVTAKDVILELLKLLTTKGNVGLVLEYGGPGVETPDGARARDHREHGGRARRHDFGLPERRGDARVLRGPGPRGATGPSSGRTPGAAYDRTIDLDLGGIEPSVALPHSPDNVRRIREVEGTAVDQVLIGSCTNSSYRDLMTVAAMLKGQKAQPGVSFGIAPGTPAGSENDQRQRRPDRHRRCGRPGPRTGLRLLRGQRPVAAQRRGLGAQQQPQLRRPLRDQGRAGLPRQPRERRGRGAHRQDHGPARPRDGIPGRAAAGTLLHGRATCSSRPT